MAQSIYTILNRRFASNFSAGKFFITRIAEASVAQA